MVVVPSTHRTVDNIVVAVAIVGLSAIFARWWRMTDDIDGGSEPDFLWFGITERMQESICLYYYSLGVMPLKRAPRARIMDCPPTSWWTEEHREEVRRLDPYDYAVWRAANAILDVRTIVMREEVRRKMAENTTTREERERYAALDEAGCLG